MTATMTPPGASSPPTPMWLARPEAILPPPTNQAAKPKGQTSAGEPTPHTPPSASGEPSPRAPTRSGAPTLPADQGDFATHGVNVGGEPNHPPAPATMGPTPKRLAPGLVGYNEAQGLLTLAAQTLDDLESSRIANENRLRSLRDVYGLAGTKQEAEAEGLVAGIAALEHQALLTLQRSLRRHPLGPWIKRTTGVGEKQGARLLAAIGDPYIRPELTRADGSVDPSRPRLVSELWAYCGLHVIKLPSGGDTGQGTGDTQRSDAGVAAARAKGQKANWNAEAKSRAWLIACSCIKQADSPYRVVYDEARAKYDGAIHQAPCRRCGPAGHPAQPGSPISAGHQHARALRAVSKHLLRDLWAEANDLHNQTGNPS